MDNAFGLDADYFIRLFARELNPDVVRNQTPACLARVLARAARTACAEVLAEPEFQQQAEQQPVVAVIGFYKGEREPRLLSWNCLPNGEHRLYAAPVAHPDVSVLVEALEQFADDSNWCYDTCDISRDVAKRSLAAYRAALAGKGGAQ